MTCTEARLAISALLDGEDPLTASDEVAYHLDGCAPCRSWRVSAEAATTTATSVARLAYERIPDMVERVIAAQAGPTVSDGTGDAPSPDPARARRRRRALAVGALRLALALSAIGQLVAALPALFSSVGELGVHHSREMASFDIAVAVGFLFAAWRPTRASALVPVAVALSLCLFVTGLVDIATDRAALPHEIGHLIVVVQGAALWFLGRAARTAPTGGAPPAGRAPSGSLQVAA